MRLVWPESVRSELRGIDRESAMRILLGLTRYGEYGEGDVKALSGEWEGCFRLRVGDFRVIFKSRRTRLRLYAYATDPMCIDKAAPTRRRCGTAIVSPNSAFSLRPV